MTTYRKTIDAGPIRIVKVYQAIRKRDKPSCTRERHRNLSTEKQQVLNEINAKEQLKLIINKNFENGKDWWIALTHEDNPNEQENKKRFERFIDRANYFLRKNGREKVEYIAVPDKGKKKGCKWHTHVIIKGLLPDEIVRIWGNSFVFFRPLYIDGHYEELAGYIVEKVRDKGKKRWWQSKGIKKPDIKVEEIPKRDLIRLHIGKKPYTPKGYRETDAEMHVNDLTGTAFRFEYEQKADRRRKSKNEKK